MVVPRASARRCNSSRLGSALPFSRLERRYEGIRVSRLNSNWLLRRSSRMNFTGFIHLIYTNPYSSASINYREQRRKCHRCNGACFHREIRRRRIGPGWATLRWCFCQRTRITFAETRDAQADQCRSNSIEERAGFEWILYFRLLLHASDLSAQKGSAAQQLGTGHQKRIWEIEKPKISVAALRKRPYMGSVEGSRSRWIRCTLVSGARRKGGRGSGRLGWR